jgi:hypothetical protein
MVASSSARISPGWISGSLTCSVSIDDFDVIGATLNLG